MKFGSQKFDHIYQFIIFKKFTILFVNDQMSINLLVVQLEF